MKKSILFILVTAIAIFIFTGASIKESVNDKANEKSSSSSDANPTGCWAANIINSNGPKDILSFHFLIDSGPHQHFFHVENYIDNQCEVNFWWYHNNAFKGIGMMNGFKFSYTLFASQDTLYYNGLITDTATGLKRMEVYSTTDTTVYFGQ